MFIIMKLHKALKTKNQIVRKIQVLKNLIQQYNSVLIENKDNIPYDTKELYDELLHEINSLVTLKYVIYQANENIQHKIFMLGEYKSLVEFLKKLDIKEGLYKSYDNSSNYVAKIGANERDKLIKNFEDKIDAIQDELDEYNATTEVDF